MILAWENLLRFLWCWSSFCCCCSSFVVFLYSHFLFDIIPLPPVDYHQVFRPILYFQPSQSQSDLRHFHFSTIPLSFYSERNGFEWAFFTHRRFKPYAPSRHFGTTCFYQSFTVTFLKFAGLHTDPQNRDPARLFVWFTVIHNLLYILNLHLCMSILQTFLLVVKTLIKNIDQ